MSSDTIDISLGGGSLKSSNFGSGIELLMNEKVKNGPPSNAGSDIDIGDLEDLEQDLQNLT